MNETFTILYFFSGKDKFVGFLIDHKADLNLNNNHNETALHQASYGGDLNYFKFALFCSFQLILSMY